MMAMPVVNRRRVEDDDEEDDGDVARLTHNDIGRPSASRSGRRPSAGHSHLSLLLTHRPSSRRVRSSCVNQRRLCIKSRLHGIISLNNRDRRRMT